MKMLKCIHLFAGLLFAGSALAVAPVAMWDGDFNNTVKGGYTLNLNGNTLAGDESYITITGSNGIYVSGGSLQHSTVLIRYSNLDWSGAASGKAISLLSHKNTQKSEANCTGIAVDNAGKLSGIWCNNIYGNPKGSLTTPTSDDQILGLACTFVTDNPVANPKEGTWAFTQNQDGTYANIYDDGGLRGTGAGKVTTDWSIGGHYGASTGNNIITSAQGMKIYSIAIFDSRLTAAELSAFEWDFSTRMFSDKLASNLESVPAGSYGDIVVPGNGYKATAYSTTTAITPTFGSLNGLIGKPNWTYLLTSTVSGWFKINALPTSSDATIYGYTRDGKTCSMRVAVTSGGKLKIGKGTGANVDSWDSGSRGGSVTTDVDVPINTWFYMTIAGQRKPEQNTGDSRMALTVFINGVQKFTQENCFLNDGDNGSSNTFVIGAGVSAAGLYGDTTAVTDTNTIKSWATDEKYVEAASWISSAMINGPTKWSELNWSETPAPGDAVKITLEGDSTLTIDEDVLVGDLIFAGSGALTIEGDNALISSSFGIGSFTLASGELSIPNDNSLTSVVVKEGAVLTLNVDSAKTLNGISGPGKVIKAGNQTLTLNNGSNGYAIDGTTIDVTSGTLLLNAGSNDAQANNATFILGENASLTQYGWYNLHGTTTFDYSGLSTKSVLGANVRTYDDSTLVKKGTGAITLNSGLGEGNGFKTITVENGALGFANMNLIKSDATFDFSKHNKTSPAIAGNFTFSQNYVYIFPSDWAVAESFQLCSGTLSGIPAGGKIENFKFYVGDTQTTADFNLTSSGSVFYNTGVMQIAPEGNYAISTLNGETIAAGQTVELTMKPGTTLTIDELAKVATAVICEGNLVLVGAGGAEPTSAQLAALDLDGVTGNIKHGWYKYAGARVIAVNFNRRGVNNTDAGGSDDHVLGENEDSGALDCDILGKGWLQVDARSSDWTSDAFIYDTATDTEVPAGDLQVKWSSKNNYMWTNATCKFLRGYLDDGDNHAQFFAKDIPFEWYSVIVYFATDNGSKFSPVTVNGGTYTWADGKTSVGATTWGAAYSNVPVYGTNALCIEKQSGDLTVVGGANSNGARGGIAAIVIVETGAATQRDVTCGTAYNISSAKTYTEDIVNLVFDDAGGVLTIDEAPQRVFNVVSKGMVTIAFSNGTSFSPAIVSKLVSKAEGGIRFVITDGMIPNEPPAAGVIYCWEGTESLATIPFVGTVVEGTIEINCPLDSLTGSTDGKITGSKNSIVFGPDFSCEDNIGFVRLGNNGGQTQNFTQNGGALTLNKSGNDGVSTDRAFTIAHWSGNVTYNFVAGTIDVPNDNTVFGWDGTAHMTIGGDTTAAIMTTKGIATGQTDNSNELTISENGTLAIGSYGADFKSNTTVTLDGGTLKAYETCAFNAPAIAVTKNSTIDVITGGEMTLNALVSGEGFVTKTGEGVLALGTAARPKLSVVSGKLRIIVSAVEIATGTIELNTDQASYSAEVFEVTDEAGEVIAINSVKVNDGVLTFNFKSNLVDVTSKVSEWVEMEGALAIKPRVDGEEIVITVDEAFPSAITAINVLGKVKFVYEDGVDASPIDINVTAASEATFTGIIQNQIVPEVGATIIIDGAATANHNILMGDGKTLIVNPNATLIFGMANPFAVNENTRTLGTYNIYGTVDLGTYNWLYESNSGACIFNFFAGSEIRGTTGLFNRGGGGVTSYNLKAFADAENSYVSFNVARANSYNSTDITLNIEEGVGFKLLKSCPNKNMLSGANIAGVELGENVSAVEIVGANTIIGDVTIGAGSTLGGNSSTVNGTLTGAGTITLPLRLGDTAEIDTQNGSLTIPSISFGNGVTIIGEPGAEVMKGLSSKPTLPATITVLDPTTLTPSEFDFELVYDLGMLTLRCKDIFFDLPTIEHAIVSIEGEGSTIVGTRALVPYKTDATIIYTADEGYSFKGGADEKYTGQTVIRIEVYADITSDSQRVVKELEGVIARTIVAKVRDGDTIIAYFDFMEAFNALAENGELTLYADALITATDPYVVLANTAITLNGFTLSGDEAVSFLIDSGVALYLYNQSDYLFDPDNQGVVDNITFTLNDGIIYSYAELNNIASDSYIKIYSEINGYTYAPSAKLETIAASLRAGETVKLPDGSEPKLIEEKLNAFGYDLQKVSTMSVGEYKVVISPDEAVNGSWIASFEIADGSATIKIPNAKANFCYGLEYADNPAFENSVKNWAKQGATELSAEAKGANMFYRVLITDKDPTIK